MKSTPTLPKNPTEAGREYDCIEAGARIRRAARKQSESGLLVDLSQLPWRDDDRKRLRLIGCPICGRDLLEDGGDSLGGHTGLPTHLADHDPEDLDLSPIEEPAAEIDHATRAVGRAD